MHSYIFGALFLWSIHAHHLADNKETVGFKSYQKCKEYHAYHSTVIHNNILFPDQIITEKSAIKYPYAGMMFDEDGDRLCAGILISEKYVMLAAHCIFNRSDGHSMIFGKDPLIYRKEDIVKVAKRILHPEYVAEPTYNDIALLELEGPVSFTESIQPACLQRALKFNTDDWLLHTWWRGEEVRQQGSQVTLLTSEECHEDFAKHRELAPYGVVDYLQMCIVDSLKNVNDSSHTPIALAIRNTGYSGYTVVGIPSLALWGEEFTKVYTRVSSYIDWIESVVWKEDFKQGCNNFRFYL